MYKFIKKNFNEFVQHIKVLCKNCVFIYIINYNVFMMYIIDYYFNIIIKNKIKNTEVRLIVTSCFIQYYIINNK